MISPELFVLVSIVLMFAKGVLSVISGALESEKSKNYGLGDVFVGLIVICIAVILYVI